MEELIRKRLEDCKDLLPSNKLAFLYKIYYIEIENIRDNIYTIWIKNTNNNKWIDGKSFIMNDETYDDYIRNVLGYPPINNTQTDTTIENFAKILKERGIKPELEVFDKGMIDRTGNHTPRGFVNCRQGKCPDEDGNSETDNAVAIVI